MFIVRAVPIARGAFTNELSFFSRDALAEGAVVKAPLRGKTVPALIVSCREAREEKTDIRKAGFSLKKIPSQNGVRLFSSAFVSAIKETALWHGAHESTVFTALTPAAVLAEAGKLPEAPEISSPGTTQPELLVFQAEREERIRTYRNLARESFARNASLLIIAPTVAEAELLSAAIERGIEERLLLITGDLSKKTLLTAWRRAVTDPQPLVIIGTPLALSVPRADLKTIIIERESARAYRAIARPHTDLRRAAEYIAQHAGARCILADFPLRVETRYRAEHGELEDMARPQMRLAHEPEMHVVDSRTKNDSITTGTTPKRTFKILSDESLEAIRNTGAAGGRTIFFSVRSGLAPLTLCNDCGTPVSDKETGTPMTLHRTAKGNVFLSHRSGAILPSETPCAHCGGWNLVSLGGGIERIEALLKKTLPETPLLVLTKETAPSHAKAKNIAEEFYRTRGGILLGTERMLPYLGSPAEMVAVSGVDTLLALPAWRAHEQTLSVLFYLAERALNSFFIETRKPDHPIMHALTSGNPTDFYRADIEERKRYGYPPFSTFISLEWKGPRPAVEKARGFIAETFSDLDLVGPLPAMADGKQSWSARAVIRRTGGAWPDSALAERLRALPPAIAITIDPDEIA